jgi:hypothetical protein
MYPRNSEFISQYSSWGVVTVVEISAERRDNGLGLGVMITAYGGEDGTVMR